MSQIKNEKPTNKLKIVNLSSKPLRDVKNISNYKNKPFLSTSNHTFIRNSDIGNYIKKKFKNKCRYEQ